jgi:hypothetical protein
VTRPYATQEKRPALLDKARLREHAREGIEKGTLPSRAPGHCWGGFGVGMECAICGAPIGTDELEMEVQFLHDGANRLDQLLHFHIRCYGAWEFVRSSVGEVGIAR